MSFISNGSEIDVKKIKEEKLLLNLAYSGH